MRIIAPSFHRRALVFELVGEYDRSLLDFNAGNGAEPQQCRLVCGPGSPCSSSGKTSTRRSRCNRAAAMAPGRDVYRARGLSPTTAAISPTPPPTSRASSKCSPADPNSAIHRYLARTRLGEDAVAGASGRRRAAHGSRFLRFAAVGLYLGTVSPDALIAQDEAEPGCQSRYYIGAFELCSRISRTRRHPGSVRPWNDAATLRGGGGGRRLARS